MSDSRPASIPKGAIEAVLFDADGVLQTASARWRERLRPLLPPGDEDVEGFMGEIFDAERPALTDGSDVIPSFRALLRRRGSTADPAEILSMLNAIDVHSEALSVVARLRESGARCYLASNQQSHRAKYMSETLGYRDLFDRQFYSCYLGHAKPSRAYFEQFWPPFSFRRIESCSWTTKRTMSPGPASLASTRRSSNCIAASTIDAPSPLLRSYGLCVNCDEDGEQGIG